MSMEFYEDFFHNHDSIIPIQNIGEIHMMTGLNSEAMIYF